MCDSLSLSLSLSPIDMITIRLLTESDFDPFYEIRGTALRTNPEAFLTTIAQHEAKPVAEERARFLHSVTHSDFAIAGAFDPDDRIVGMLGLYRRREDPAYQHRAGLWGMFVRPEARRQGAGRQLVARLISVAAQMDGVTEVVLSVMKENDEAIPFYTGLNFEPFEPEGRDPLLADALPGEVHMSRPLPLSLTDPLTIAETLLQTVDILDRLLSHLPESVVEWKGGPDDWSIKEVIGHLIAADQTAFYERIETIVSSDRDTLPDIPGFHPGRAATARDDNATPLIELLAELGGSRRAAADYILSLDMTLTTKEGHYPKYGRFNGFDFLFEWPYHDHDHLQQILDILKRQYLPAMSTVMQGALGHGTGVSEQ